MRLRNDFSRPLVLSSEEIEYFWSRVEKSPGCWRWTGAASHGYGVIVFRGVSYDTHRLAYALSHGVIATGLLVCHHCDTPPCVRPDHLFLGTILDNNRDARRKGRGTSGDRARCRTVLDWNAVAEIRRRRSLGERNAQLAVAFSVHNSTISRVVQARRWTKGA